MENVLPVYLENEYVIQENEHLSCLGDLISWYWCSIPILRENVEASGVAWNDFLLKIKECVTMYDMKKIVNQYI